MKRILPALSLLLLVSGCDAPLRRCFADQDCSNAVYGEQGGTEAPICLRIDWDMIDDGTIQGDPPPARPGGFATAITLSSDYFGDTRLERNDPRGVCVPRTEIPLTLQRWSSFDDTFLISIEREYSDAGMLQDWGTDAGLIPQEPWVPVTFDMWAEAQARGDAERYQVEPIPHFFFQLPIMGRNTYMACRHPPVDDLDGFWRARFPVRMDDGRIYHPIAVRAIWKILQNRPAPYNGDFDVYYSSVGLMVGTRIDTGEILLNCVAAQLHEPFAFMLPFRINAEFWPSADNPVGVCWSKEGSPLKTCEPIDLNLRPELRGADILTF